MELQTKIDIPQSQLQIAHSEPLLLLGSCFAQGIGERMTEAFMPAMVNPFGTLYNPLSIVAAVGALFGVDDSICSSCCARDSSGRWFNWMFDTSLSASTQEECVAEARRRLSAGRRFVRNTRTLIITLGTNRYYALADDGSVVANCHKQPSSLFREGELSAGQCADWLDSMVKSLPKRVRVVFTVSPIRYRKYGYHESQVSKANLLVAVDTVCKANPERCFYFPAYEIVLDELRDYRFYNPDMIHPSEQTVDYVWERFCESFLSAVARKTITECQHLRQMLSHKLQEPQSEEGQKFLNKIIDEISLVKKKYPYIGLEKELNKCLIQLKK